MICHERRARSPAKRQNDNQRKLSGSWRAKAARGLEAASSATRATTTALMAELRLASSAETEPPTLRQSTKTTSESATSRFRWLSSRPQQHPCRSFTSRRSRLAAPKSLSLSPSKLIHELDFSKLSLAIGGGGGNLWLVFASLLTVCLLIQSSHLANCKSITEGSYSSGQSINISSLADKEIEPFARSPSQQQNHQQQQPQKDSRGTEGNSTIFPEPEAKASSAITTKEDPTEISDEDILRASKDDSSTGDADDDAEDCKGLSVGPAAEGKNYTDHERLVNLQSCFQRKVRQRILGATRSGLDLFDKMSLSGGCASSLMNLMSNLGEIKSFAFKFLDASAKIPSGMMYGLLSDFGDFDQCLSIRANPQVSLEDEIEEGSYSGKYCLLSLKLNYHIELDSNKSVPEGIIADGVIWDELVRNYWTSDSPKGFQVGMCFPSRCTNDDLDQIFRQVTSGYNIVGEVMSCQDGRDIRAQQTADLLQRVIIYAFYTILALTLVGSAIDRYSSSLVAVEEREFALLFVKTLLCFSIIRNWKHFMQTDASLRRVDDLSRPKTNANLASRTQQLTPSSSQSTDYEACESNKDVEASKSSSASSDGKLDQLSVDVECQDRESQSTDRSSAKFDDDTNEWLGHLAGLKLFIIIWITIGHSFLYPSANNYQYYRSIISMNMTKDSVWFATTNFTLGIDMLLYITGFLFVVKLFRLSSMATNDDVDKETSLNKGNNGSHRSPMDYGNISRLLLGKVLRFWPTYASVIAIAIVVPLVSDGPMWPEMVTKRLGESCRKNWWANLLIVNNFLSQSDVCLPSSWFLSVLMQSFIIGSVILFACRKLSPKVTILALLSLLLTSMGVSFAAAYLTNVRAPVIKMDESFVLDLDENIFRLYTNLFNNLGPFIVGMIGGFILLNAKLHQRHELMLSSRGKGTSPSRRVTQSNGYSDPIKQTLVAAAVLIVAILVLSSVFHSNYTRFWASVYWSSHRVGWAIVTGYIIHQCAMGRWKLLGDLLSLSTFIPLSRLIFIAYLVYPIFIHIHSGLVRDGLHISIYNMLNIYTTRLVMTFATAGAIHLLVVSPICSLERLYLRSWIQNSAQNTNNKKKKKTSKIFDGEARTLPLLAVVPLISTLGGGGNKVTEFNSGPEQNDEPKLNGQTEM